MELNDLTPIFTIGYGNRPIVDFLDLLNANNIAFLIDVRSAPYSRQQPDYAKQALAAHCQQVGIRYVFMGDTLGGRPDDPNVYVDDELNDYLLMQTGYFQRGIGRVKAAFDQQRRVVLMCSELKPENCHRSRLIGAALDELNVPVAHIDEKGALQSQDEVMARKAAQPKPRTLDLSEVNLNGKTPLEVLSTVFGYESFRPLQERIISQTLTGNDALVIMPTGGGKSLCYQLPALMQDGLTVVVSPLIALMQDQVTQLRELGVPATYLNSTLDYMTAEHIRSQVRNGDIKLLYVAPETLLRSDTLDLIAQSRLQTLAIDEAHCVSQWGHDFRPEYRRISEVRQRFPNATCIALTATATPRVQDDIRHTLAFQDDAVFLGSFDRPNLNISIRPKSNLRAQVFSFINTRKGQSGIIYCSTRRQVDNLAYELEGLGVSVAPYHAGMSTEARRQNQDAFIRDNTNIIVATIAFGMGIDKPDVRFVLHTHLPKNIENYYQQIGRAGRDGLNADCELLFSYGDLANIRRLIGEGAAHEAQGRESRLQQFVNWIEDSACRRHGLLSYFGEESTAETCTMCDNCTRPAQAQVDISAEAQKFLACVYRTGQSFGLSHIVNVLRGSKAKTVTNRGHHNVSTWGIGKELSTKQWQHLARQFIKNSLLNQNEFGGLQLTEDGIAAMKGQQPVMGTHLETETLVVDATLATEYNIPLFELLRRERKQLADARNIPPYVVCADRSLMEMATWFPHSAETFAKIHGIGQHKVEQYGDIFIPLIVTYCRENNLQERRREVKRVTVTRRVSSGNKVPRWLEVGEMFDKGDDVNTIATHFDVKRQTVISNLSKYSQNGYALPLARLEAESTLNTADIAYVQTLMEDMGTSSLSELFNACSGHVSYEELHLHRLIHHAKTKA